MIYKATVMNMDQIIEEEVTIAIGDLILTCFANIVPYQLQLGVSYMVALTPTTFEGYSIREIAPEEKSITRITTDYSYTVIGTLSGNQVDCGKIAIEDDYLSTEFAYLDGNTIEWKVDRLDLEFL